MGVYDELSKLAEDSPARRAYVVKNPSRSRSKSDDKMANALTQEATASRNRDTVASRYHATTIEQVRKAVKELGKEAATHRFTIDEKKAIADLIYSYKGQGIRTSENEVTRIAVNFAINDYKQNGKNSILDRALRALND